MTGTELNDRFAQILDGFEELITQFDQLRSQSSDEEWDDACESRPWGDLLCDLEYETQQVLAQVRA